MEFTTTNTVLFSNSSNFTTQSFSDEIEVGVKLAGTPYFLAEICLSIIAFIGNSVILGAFAINKKLRTIPHLYIISLVVSDFGMGAFGIPILLCALVGLPKNNYILCMTLLTLVMLLDFCSIFSLLALTFDRYYAICWPLHYNAHMSWFTASIVLGIAWLIPFSLAIIMPLWWNYGDPNSTECIFLDIVSLDYLTWMLIISITIPFLLMCAMYAAMFRVIQRQIREIAKIHNIGRINNQQSNNEGGQNTDSTSSSSQEIRAKYNKVQKERKTALLFGLLLACFLFTWGPIFLLDCLLYFGIYIGQFWINFAVALSHFNSAFNPVIYSFKSEFRQTYKRMFCCWFKNNRVGPGSDTDTSFTDSY